MRYIFSITYRLFIFFILASVFFSQVYGGSLPNTMGLTAEGMRFTVASNFLSSIKVEPLDLVQAQILSPDKGLDSKQRKFHIQYKLPTNLSDSNQNKDHLVLVIPGFGSPSDQGVSVFMVELLTRSGFTAAALDSPPSLRFLSDSSRYGFPGVQEFDSQDLYEGMQLTKKYLENLRSYGKPFSKVSVIGTSLGGLNVSQILLHSLKPTSTLKFHRAISVNPPVSNVYGLSIIDYMVRNYIQGVTAGGKSMGKVPALLKGFHNKLLEKISYEELEKQVKSITNPLNPMSQEEAAYLIGYSFSDTVASALKGTAVRQNLSQMQLQSGTFYEIYNRITMGYLAGTRERPEPDYPIPAMPTSEIKIANINKEVLTQIRGIQQSDFLTEPDDIQIEMSSIRYNVESLKNAKNYVLITYVDDFLLRTNVTDPKIFEDDDKSWIRKNFDGAYIVGEGPTKARSKVYFEGGHLGGYYQKMFQNDLIQFLTEDL
jgi:hypothetical protein